MTFTLENVVNSLAGVLSAQYPNYPVYASPNQQGTSYPCFFVFFMPSTIEEHIGNRLARDLGVDIVFVQQRNIAGGNEEIIRIADYLDQVMTEFPYQDGSGKIVPVHTCERQWQTEDQELHYQFHIRERVALPEEKKPMQNMEENHAGVKE